MRLGVYERGSLQRRQLHNHDDDQHDQHHDHDDPHPRMQLHLYRRRTGHHRMY